MEFTAQLAARWVDTEKKVAELSDAYQRDTQRLGRERDETSALLDMARTHIAELTDKLARSEQAAEFMSTDLNERADTDDLNAELPAEVGRFKEALAVAFARNATQVQTILEARRQRDGADQRANQLADERDALTGRLVDVTCRADQLESQVRQLEAERDEGRRNGALAAPQGVPKDGPPPIRPDGSGLDAQTIAGLMAARGRDFRVVSPYLAGQWRVLRTYGSNSVVLTPMFGPAHEQFSIDGELRWLQLDDAEF